MKQPIAATVSLVILLGAPGPRAYAQLAAPRAAAGTTVGVVTVTPAAVSGARAAAPSAPAPNLAPVLGQPSVLPTAPALTPTVRANVTAAAAAKALALPSASAVAAQPANVLAAPTAAKVSALSRGVASAVESAGPVAEAAPADAHALGGRLEAILSGVSRPGAAASAVTPEHGDWQGLSSDRYFGKPAGHDSIAGAVRAHHARFGSAAAETPAAPAPQEQEPAPPARKTPFLPKLISSGLALVPAVLIGWPLFAAGSTLAGGAVLAASAALMALPFMGERTPAFIRAVPGLAVLGLGGLTLVGAFLGGASLWMGAFVTLGGWGLLRYGVKTEQNDRYDRDKALTAYFGAVGAVLGAGLAVAAMSAVAPLALTGWMVTGATWLAYPLTGLLFLHLPGWVGEGIEAAFKGAYTSGRAAHRVLRSIHRDTVLQDRLVSFTKRHLSRSAWNAIWLSAIWVPLWIVEAVMFALSAAAGLAFGAAMAPTMFAWGAVHKLWEKSAATKFLGAWNHFIFDWAQGSKIRVYNRFAKPLVALANQGGALGWAAGTALRAVQVAWLAYAALAFPVVTVLGFLRAFGKTAEEYDYRKHSPDYLRVDTNDRPDVERPEEPEDPGKPAKSSFFPRLIAAGVAVLPLYFLALPLLGAPVVGQLYGLAGLALAAMPFLPAGSPKLVKQLPGWLLLGLGLAATASVPYFLFGDVGVAVLASQNSLWMGLVTALSGWGLIRYAGTLGRKEGQKWYSVDDPEYIGAFFGAVGVLTGLGVSMLGLAGWLPLALKVGGYAASLLLLIHLPRWVGTGLSAAAEGLWASVRAYSKVLSFWDRDTKFARNLSRHARYWLDKSVWNGSWLSVIWVPYGVMVLAEWLAAGVLGLATGLLRAPLNFLWGAAYKIAPEAKLTRFIAGFVRATFEQAEGSKKAVFDRWVAPLIPAMDEAHPVSGRPTFRAAAAFLAARLAQAAWLARLAFWSPAILILSIVAGFKNAAGPRKQPGEDEYGHKDDPGATY